MKKTTLVLMVLVMLIACTKTQPKSKVAKNASESGKDDSIILKPKTYVVKYGDCMWDIAKDQNGRGSTWYSKLVRELNPGLQKGIKIDSSNYYAWCDLWPGNKILIGFDTVKIIVDSHYMSFKLWPWDTTYAAKIIPTVDTLTSKFDDSLVSDASDLDFWGWFFFVLIFGTVAGFIIYGIVNRKNLNRDPVNSGPPMHEGGVDDRHVYEYTEERIRSLYPSSTFRIVNIQKGFFSGIGKVHYNNGKTKRIKLRRTDGYQGRVIVNGEEKVIQFLQGCGNDVQGTNGKHYSGFNFTAVSFVRKNATLVPVSPVVPEAVQNTQTFIDDTTPVVPSNDPVALNYLVSMEVVKIVQTELAKEDQALYKVEFSVEGGKLSTSIQYNKDNPKKD